MISNRLSLNGIGAGDQSGASGSTQGRRRDGESATTTRAALGEACPPRPNKKIVSAGYSTSTAAKQSSGPSTGRRREQDPWARWMRMSTAGEQEPGQGRQLSGQWTR